MNKKALNLPILVSMVIGNMIGTGIYLLPASLAQFGSISLLAWVYTSLGALLLALTFSFLNKRYPKTGGPYVYCRNAFGKPVGFVVAYTYWISNLVSIAGIAVASIGYLGMLLPTFDANNAQYSAGLVLATEIGAVWFFTLVNLIGLHTAGVLQLILTLIKLLPLVFVIAFGLSHIEWQNLSTITLHHQSNFTALGSAAALTFWAFIGLESATIPAENTESSRDVFKATVYGTLATACIYLLSTFVLMGMIPTDQLARSQFPFAQAGALLFGSQAAWLIALCAVISGLGALNVCVLIQGQIVFAAARDHLFPRVFARLSKHDVPIAAQLLSSCLTTLLLVLTANASLLKQFNYIALLAGVLTLLTYLMTTLAEIKLIYLDDKKWHRLLTSKSFLIAILACAYSTWMLTNFDTQLLFVCVAILLCCVPIYFFTVRKYSEA